MKVCIYVDENRGYVHYNPFTHKVMVTNPVDKIRWAVYRYLTTKRNFDMPDGGMEGSKETIEAVPTDSTGFLELALCEMFHTIKVHVDWGDPNNTGGYEAESVGADDTSPDKPIVKSLDGIKEYQIIN